MFPQPPRPTAAPRHVALGASRWSMADAVEGSELRHTLFSRALYFPTTSLETLKVKGEKNWRIPKAGASCMIDEKYIGW